MAVVAGVGVGVKILIPGTPPAELSPNARVHWRTKHRASKQLRTMARYAALGSATFTGPVVVHTTIAWEPRRRTLDSDNALACCKAIYDGLQDAGVVINDKQMIFAPVEQMRDPDKQGFVLVELEAS